MLKKCFTGFVIVSAIVYMFVLCYLLFSGFGRTNIMLSEDMRLNYAYNLIPFKTIAEYLKSFGRGHATMNLIGNLLLFFPLGFYLPFLFPQMAKIKAFVLSVALLIIVVEVVQLMTMTGSLDIDDFILNFGGALIGHVVFICTPIRSVFTLRAYSIV